MLYDLKMLRIDLLPIILFKDHKFGGYVAENYSALSMILPWCSNILNERHLALSNRVVVPDVLDKPVGLWTGTECKSWLEQHGYDEYVLSVVCLLHLCCV